MKITKEMLLDKLKCCEVCSAHQIPMAVKFCSTCGARQQTAWVFLGIYFPEEWERLRKQYHKAKEDHCHSNRKGFAKHRLYKMFRRTDSRGPDYCWNFCPLCGERLDD